MPALRAAARTESLWHNRDYMLLWSGQLVSTTGSGLSMFAFPLLVLSLTRSPVQAGIAGALYAVPYLFLSLPAGALVDRWDRKRVMIVCDAVRALNAATIPLAAALSHLTVAQLYLNSLVEGSMFVFFNVAEVACLPRVVSTEQLPAASAQNEAGMITAGLISSPLSGFIYQTIGRTVPFLVDAVSYAASVASLALIKTEFQEQRAGRPRALRAEIAEGLRWLWNQPLICYMAFLTGGLNFSNAGLGLLVIILAQRQGASPATIGLVFSIGSIGGILGALIAPRIQRRFGFGQVIVATTWVGALLWPLFDLAPNPLLLGAVTCGLFLTSPIYNAVQFSYRLSLIPDALQGRVNSAFRLVAFGFQPLGAALSGLLIQAVGVRPAVLCFAATVLALAVLTSANAHVRGARPAGVTTAA